MYSKLEKRRQRKQKHKQKHMTQPTSYVPHKIASVYPPLKGSEYTALRVSIRTHGLFNPVTLYEGKILDGTNRYRACLDEGIAPTFRDLPEGVDPVDFVISQNDTRRHLTREQLVLIGARLATLRRGGDRKDGYKASAESEKSTDAVAAKLKVSKSGIKRAQKVIAKGTPKVQEALESSELKVHQAEVISRLPKGQQDAVLDAVRSDRKNRKAGREALKAAKKGGLKVEAPKPDLEVTWGVFLPRFVELLDGFKAFKVASERSEIRHRITECLTFRGFVPVTGGAN